MTSQAEGEIREETFTSLIHSGPKGTLLAEPGQSWELVYGI